MDEVDGMSSDRGGIAALINQIKETSQPIICICNDRESQKMKTLARYCYDLKFANPNSQDIFNLLRYIFGRKYQGDEFWNLIDKSFVSSVIEKANFDIRQILVFFEMWIDEHFDYVKRNVNVGFKDQNLFLNNFEAAKRILHSKLNQYTNFKLLENWFFIDYNMMDILVFENYLQKANQSTKPKNGQNIKTSKSKQMRLKKRDLLDDIDQALDSMVIGDIISKKIKRNRDYSILRPFSYFSVIRPSLLFNRFVSYMHFPIFYNKLSTHNKRERLVKEMKDAFSTSCNILTKRSILSTMRVLSRMIIYNLNNFKFENNFRLYLNYDMHPDMLKENFAIMLKFYSEDDQEIDKKSDKQFKSYYHSKMSLKKVNEKTSGKKTQSKTTRSNSQSLKSIKSTVTANVENEDEYSWSEFSIDEEMY